MNATIYEKQYLGRTKVQKNDYSYAILLILLVLAATLFNSMILNPWWKTVPVQNPAVAALSDKAQERLYCAEWYRGETTVLGGSTEAIKGHCAAMRV